MRHERGSFVRTPGLTPSESFHFKKEATDVTDKRQAIEQLSSEFERSMVELFGKDYHVHSGFAQLVRRVCNGEEPNAVIATLRNPQRVQMAAANTGWSHDGQPGD